MSPINSSVAQVLLQLYEIILKSNSSSGEVEDCELAHATDFRTNEVYSAMKSLENLGLVEYTEKEGPGPDPRIFFQYQLTDSGMQKAKILSRDSGLEHRSSQTDPVLAKVNVVETEISTIQSQMNDLTKKVDHLVSATEDKSYLRPRFVESSPGKRTFGKEIEDILSNILASNPPNVEILIMGYFDHDSIDKLKEVLAAKGKVRIIHPDLTASKQDLGNLDALKRIERNGAEVRVHPMLHARIFYLSRDGQPWGVIVGSGDIKSDCLGGRRFDAGIWSNHPDIIKSVQDFFNRVWEDEGVKKLSDIRPAK